MELMRIELEMFQKQMQQEKERHQKQWEEQQKAYEAKIRLDQGIDQIRVKMKNIRKDVAEANEIAKFMNKDVSFTDIYVSKFDDQGIYGGSGATTADGEPQDEVQVKVENFDIGAVFIWSADKFQDKLAMMRDVLKEYEDNEFAEMTLEPEQDPFYERPEPILLGQAFYMLEGLAYLMDNPRKIPIIATNNKICGELSVNLVPCDEEGNEDLDEDLLSDEPMDLLNQSLDFKVKIAEITSLPEDFCRNIFCEYEFYMDKAKYSTPVSNGKNQAPVFNYERQHHVDCVTKFLIDYLLEDKMTIKIFGNQELKRTKKPPTTKASNQHAVQVQSKSTRPMFTEKSSDMSKPAGANSTMNSSVSSQGSSSNNYKIVGQTVSTIPVKQLI